MGLSASSLDGGFGLTPFTYVVVGRVILEKAVVVDSGEQTLVSEKISRKYQTAKRKRGEKQQIKSNQLKEKIYVLCSFKKSILCYVKGIQQKLHFDMSHFVA